MELLRSLASSTFLSLFALIAVIAMEHLGPRERYTLRDRLPGFLMNAIGTFLSLALVWPLNWAWFELGVPPLLMIPLSQWVGPLGFTGKIIQILVLVAAADFLIYWRHRAEHAWFWPIHLVHHAPRELHAANDIGHPLQIIISFVFVTVPLSLIQLDGPATPAAVGAIVGIANMLIHSPVEWHLGPLRKIIVDNRFHRIHHSLEERHFDKNFGICFSLWDWMFGTAYEPGEEWPAVGVDQVKAPITLWEFLALPLASFRDRRARQSSPATDLSQQLLEQP